MPHPHVRLFESSPSSTFHYDGEPHDLAPRPLADVQADIQAALDAGAQWVMLGHHEPLAYPHLRDALETVTDGDARAKIVTNGRLLDDPAKLERLRDESLAQVTVVFWGGTAKTHDARVGHPGAFRAAMATLKAAFSLNSMLVTARYVLMRDNVDELSAFVTAIRQESNRMELVRLGSITTDRGVLSTQGVRRRDAVRAAQAAWEAARVVHLKLETVGFGTYPHLPAPRDVAVQPADMTLLGFLRNNVPVPAASNGTWATPSTGDVSGIWYAVEQARTLQDLGLQLAAYGCPPLDLPPTMGGLGLDYKPEDEAKVAAGDVMAVRKRDGVSMMLQNVFDEIDTRPLPSWSGPGRSAKVAIVSGYLTDNILALSTLPALQACLSSLGAEATLHSVWSAPFNPYDNGIRLEHTETLQPADDGQHLQYAPDRVEAMANTPARMAHARRQGTAFLQGLDLSSQDLVVVPGFDNALTLLDNPTLPETARVVVIDFHMLSGIGGWHQRWLNGGRSMDGGWWPDERITVHTLYPHSVRAYWRAGIPLRQLAWRPYPLHTGHFPRGPEPASCRRMFSGGSHQRDFATLAAALQILGKDRAPETVIHTPLEVPPPLQNLGEVRLLHFYEAIANSRFVVLPMEPDNRRPAGISVMSLALAAGRPIIASATPAAVDHLRHGHNAILVPPKRPKALAKAIARLQEDDALLTRLSEGARQTTEHLSVQRWAEHLLDGAPAATTWTLGEPHKGPFFSWPA